MESRINYIGSWAWNVRTGALLWCVDHFRICGLEPGSVQPSYEVFLTLVHPDDRAEVDRCFDRALRQRTEYRCRYRIVRPDRSIRNIEAVARLVLDEKLEPAQFVGTILDDTEQLPAALLRENERRFASMLDSIPHQVWTYRTDGTIGYCNQKLLEYSGLSSEELQRVGRNDQHPDEVEKVQRAWREAFESGAPYEMEQRIRGRDGTYRRFLCRAVPIRDQWGQLVEYFVTATDVEELRRSDQALRSAQTDLARMSRIAVLGEISASLAHELNQPLAAIVANCDASLRWQGAVPPNLEQIALAGERIRRDALRANAMLERIRAIIRKAAPEHTPVELPDAVHEVLEMLDTELQRHHIEMQVLISPSLPPVAGTRVELQQVFLNLFTNAIESLAHEKPDIRRRLSVECARGHVSHAEVVFVIVQDSGPGFPNDDQERLFDAFFTTKSEGLGMGLAVSRSIVRRHGGDLRARNTPEGPRFEFYVPLMPPSTGV